MASLTLDLPPWEPPTAEDRLRQLWSLFPNPGDRACLHRLGTHDIMRTHVWAKLPKSPEGSEGAVIDAAFTLSRPGNIRYLLGEPVADQSEISIPMDRDAGDQDVLKYASALKAALQTRAATIEPDWSAFCRGSPFGDFQSLIAALETAERFFAERERERLSFWQTVPKLRRGPVDKTPERLFCPMMAWALRQIYAVKPAVPVVVVLAEVVFNRPGEVSLDTVRQRLRQHHKQLAAVFSAAARST